MEQQAALLKQTIAEACKGLVDRESLVDLIVLAAVAREHLLIIGPPGTGKSAAVRQVSKTLGGRYFEYLLGRFTEPSEIFGPVDLTKLQQGIVETATEGMLPEADIAFLDEVFLGSTAILNTLLGVLNERQFRRGHSLVNCPLRLCVGASNHLPDDESLAAFADRFLIHTFIEPVADSALESLLERGWSGAHQEINKSAGLQLLDDLSSAARDVDLSQVQPALAHCIRLLRKGNIELSDRRIVKSQNLIAAAAVLAGRSTATKADIWPLIFVVPTEQEQQDARDLLREELENTENNALNAAAEQASLGPLVRAQRLTEQAKELLATEASQSEIEALGREIDASFPVRAMPEALQEVRNQLIAKLGEVGA
ncbi:AAA family ATPase [Sessilibacter corallicola]|uniref:AAA+ ATPase domain-containing protein n=1 Tax=Sessilibacter corallicola TaxID=2904075 RepID=A0ABQ0A8D2_9GAMM